MLLIKLVKEYIIPKGRQILILVNLLLKPDITNTPTGYCFYTQCLQPLPFVHCRSNHQAGQCYFQLNIPQQGRGRAGSNAERKGESPAFNSQHTTAVQVVLAPKPSKQHETLLPCPPLLVGCLCRPHTHDTSSSLMLHVVLGFLYRFPFSPPDGLCQISELGESYRSYHR